MKTDKEIKLCAWCIHQKSIDKKKTIKCKKRIWKINYGDLLHSEPWNTVQGFASNCKYYEDKR